MLVVMNITANIFTRTSWETTRVYIHDEKVAYLTFEGRKKAKKIVKTTFLQKKMKKVG